MNVTTSNGLVKPKHTNTTLHQALTKLFPKLGKCEYCGSDESTAYALIHGRQYSLNRKDYMELCRSCHNSYDHHTSIKIPCSCKFKNKRYEHGKAYELIEREDVVLKVCEYSQCDVEFYTGRANKIYCSSICKLYAFREKTGVVTKQERQVTICQREDCDNKIPENTKITARYCSNACRQKVYNDKNKDRAKEKRDQIRVIQTEAKQKKQEKQAIDDFIKELMGE